MSTTGEDGKFICSQKLSYDDYLFFYDDDYNNVVDLINTTPESEDTPQAEISDEDLVDTMLDDMLDDMECGNDRICDDDYYICGQEH